MTQTADLMYKMAEFFRSEEFFEKGEDARLELSPDDVRCMNRIIKACGNGVSRQAVLDMLEDINAETEGVGFYYEHYVDYVKSLSSIKPQEPTGHWFVDERPESDREIICSNCEQPILKYHKLDFDYRPKYCPNCGCRMVEPQETKQPEISSYYGLRSYVPERSEECHIV